MEVVVIDCLEEDAALALSPFVAAAVVANERMASNRGSNTSAIGLNFGNIILDLGSFSLLWIQADIVPAVCSIMIIGRKWQGLLRPRAYSMPCPGFRLLRRHSRIVLVSIIFLSTTRYT